MEPSSKVLIFNDVSLKRRFKIIFKSGLKSSLHDLFVVVQIHDLLSFFIVN